MDVNIVRIDSGSVITRYVITYNSTMNDSSTNINWLICIYDLFWENLPICQDNCFL